MWFRSKVSPTSYFRSASYSHHKKCLTSNLMVTSLHVQANCFGFCLGFALWKGYRLQYQCLSSSNVDAFFNINASSMSPINTATTLSSQVPSIRFLNGLFSALSKKTETHNCRNEISSQSSLSLSLKTPASFIC